MVSVTMVACTSDFLGFNTDPNAITRQEASAKFFLTNIQFPLLAPDRYPYWRAHLIHADRYAGHATFGFNGSWWSDELGYSRNTGYVDAAWDWLGGYFGNLDNFLKMTTVGGEFENERMYAIGLIIKSQYFQLYTDTFGEIPYSETGNIDILLPKYDTQKEIYKGILADLNEAMTIIGTADRTGDGVEDVGNNDIFCGGDLQKWKRMANTLKLRIAMRAHGATGDDFSDAAITQALAAPLLETEDILMEKDNIISQWGSACYGDVWWNFSNRNNPDQASGSQWKVGQTLIDYLRDNNDPRLEIIAQPALGGTVVFDKTSGNYTANRVDFILGVLDDAGVVYNKVETATDITIDMPSKTYYVGQPTRLNGQIYEYAKHEFFSKPAESVIRDKNTTAIFPEIVITSAEAYFLRAEAALLGFSAGGTAEELYQNGIRRAFGLWGANADDFIANEDMAKLNGTVDQNLEKVAVQRWIAAYTDGFEAWSVVRKSGYPASLATGVSDVEIFGLGEINGAYPQRLPYGSSAYSKNGTNLNIAIGRQGPDQQDVKLWWAK